MAFVDLGVLNRQQMYLVLSGTGIELQALARTTMSGTLKPESYQLQHVIGSKTRNVRLNILSSMYQQIGPMRGGRNLSTGHGPGFVEGNDPFFNSTPFIRYRSTATLISFIFQVGYRSPHRTVNAYVEALTDFKPTDAGDWAIYEPELPFNPKTEVSKLNFDKMSQSFPPSVKSSLP